MTTLPDTIKISASTSSDIKSSSDTKNNHIPLIGFGSSGLSNPAKSIELAVNAGFRMFDCADKYGNQSIIGCTLEQLFATNQITREDVFLISKIWNTDHKTDDVMVACKRILEQLKLKQLDLLLMHWPLAMKKRNVNNPLERKRGMELLDDVSIRETWTAMESLVQQGLVRFIGVSNFTVAGLLDLLTYAKIKPVVNQVEYHPFLQQTRLHNFCKQNQIQLQAYCPLGGSSNKDVCLLTHPIVTTIAAHHHKTPANILCRWAIQQDISVIPKSDNAERIKENFQVYDFHLSEKEMTQIYSLHSNVRVCDPMQLWGIPLFD